MYPFDYNDKGQRETGFRSRFEHEAFGHPNNPEYREMIQDEQEHDRELSERSQEQPDIRHELTVCPDCEGNGWTSEHDPADPHVDGVCTNCPVQVQCETCEATGIVWKKDLPEPDNDPDDSDSLPF